MKKLVSLLCLTLMLCGCGKTSSKDVIKDFKNNINNVKSYKVTGNMEISNDEETFTYSLESYYLKDNYYKVILVNQTNNHEQIILKNNDDIYVITPDLNKSFKFQSEWPDNSSQAYLLGSLVSDLESDSEATVEESEDGSYVIKSKVNYPNNEELKYQKIYLNKKLGVEKVEVYNDSDIVKIKVTFTETDLKAGLKESDFKLDDYVKEEVKDNDSTSNDKTNEKENGNDSSKKEENTGINEEVKNEGTENPCEGRGTCKNEESTTNVENIIYPLYIPSNTYLTSSETVETSAGNRVILTFSGDKNFVLIEEASKVQNDMEIIPVYGEPLLLSEAIGALSANSLSWDAQNISYYLASTELSVAEMELIANSLGNETLVSSIK